MDIVAISKKVITDAIINRASQKGISKSDVQITLYAISEKEVGVVWLLRGQAEAKTTIPKILGMIYALASSVVNDKIYNTLNKFSEVLQVSILTLNARLHIKDNELVATLYLNGEFYKNISIEEIIN